MRGGVKAALSIAAVAALAACALPERKLGDTVFVVLPEDDGSVGEIVIDDGQSLTTLNNAYAAAHRTSGGVRPVAVDDRQIENLFGAALAAQPVPPRDFILYFELGSDQLTPESEEAIGALFADLDRRVAPTVDVIGHTDTLGDADSNRSLSRKRAIAIMEMLIVRGIDANAISAVGRGERDLLIPTDDGIGEPRNRRVEITAR